MWLLAATGAAVVGVAEQEVTAPPQQREAPLRNRVTMTRVRNSCSVRGDVFETGPPLLAKPCPMDAVSSLGRQLPDDQRDRFLGVCTRVGGRRCGRGTCPIRLQRLTAAETGGHIAGVEGRGCSLSDRGVARDGRRFEDWRVARTVGVGEEIARRDDPDPQSVVSAGGPRALGDPEVGTRSTRRRDAERPQLVGREQPGARCLGHGRRVEWVRDRRRKVRTSGRRRGGSGRTRRAGARRREHDRHESDGPERLTPSRRRSAHRSPDPSAGRRRART